MGRAGDLELVSNAPGAVEDGEGSAGQRGGDDRPRAGLHVVRAIGHAGGAAHAPVREIVYPHGRALAAGHEGDSTPEADVLGRRIGAERAGARAVGGGEDGEPALAPGRDPHPPAARREGDVVGREGRAHAARTALM